MAAAPMAATVAVGALPVDSNALSTELLAAINAQKQMMQMMQTMQADMKSEREHRTRLEEESKALKEELKVLREPVPTASTAPGSSASSSSSSAAASPSKLSLAGPSNTATAIPQQGSNHSPVDVSPSIRSLLAATKKEQWMRLELKFQAAGVTSWNVLTDIIARYGESLLQQSLGLTIPEWLNLKDDLFKQGPVLKHIMHDNSNMWLGAQSAVGRLRSLMSRPGDPDRPKEGWMDNRVRLDFGEMLKTTLRAEECYRATLSSSKQKNLPHMDFGHSVSVGSRPPTSDTWWKIQAAAGFEQVHTTWRSPFSKRENQVDHNLISAIFDLAYSSGCRSGNHIFALFSGDIGYQSTILSILEKHPNISIEIWAWESTVNHTYKDWIKNDTHKGRVVLYLWHLHQDSEESDLDLKVSLFRNLDPHPLIENIHFIYTQYQRDPNRQQHIQAYEALIVQPKGWQASTSAPASANPFGSLASSSRAKKLTMPTVDVLFEAVGREGGLNVGVEYLPLPDGRIIMFFRMVAVLKRSKVVNEFQTLYARMCANYQHYHSTAKAKHHDIQREEKQGMKIAIAMLELLQVRAQHLLRFLDVEVGVFQANSEVPKGWKWGIDASLPDGDEAAEQKALQPADQNLITTFAGCKPDVQPVFSVDEQKAAKVARKAAKEMKKAAKKEAKKAAKRGTVAAEKAASASAADSASSSDEEA